MRKLLTLASLDRRPRVVPNDFYFPEIIAFTEISSFHRYHQWMEFQMLRYEKLMCMRFFSFAFTGSLNLTIRILEATDVLKLHMVSIKIDSAKLTLENDNGLYHVLLLYRKCTITDIFQL